MKNLLLTACLGCLVIIGCEPQTSQAPQIPQPHLSADVTIKCSFNGLGAEDVVTIDATQKGKTLQAFFLPGNSWKKIQLTICTTPDAAGYVWKYIPPKNTDWRNSNILPVGEEYFRELHIAPKTSENVKLQTMLVASQYFDPKKGEFVFLNEKSVNESTSSRMPIGHRYETTFLLRNLFETKGHAYYLTFKQFDIKTATVDENKILVVKVIAPDSFRTL